MATQKRTRPAITLTLGARTMTYLNTYAENHSSNRSDATDTIIARYEFLTSSADLSNISLMEFQTICGLAQGVSTTDAIAPRNTLIGPLYQKISDQNEFREMLQNKPIGFFKDDSLQNRDEFQNKLDEELIHIQSIIKLIKSFDEIQCMALLEYVEKVIAPVDEDGIIAISESVHSEMRKNYSQRISYPHK